MDFKFVTDNFNKYYFNITGNGGSVNTRDYTTSSHCPITGTGSFLTLINEDERYYIGLFESKDINIIITGVKEVIV